ncbi:anti-sigma factor family protein [Streptomyces acidicola]|uniref:Zf-HC2 domain-containing protein n=1 Tax=Streptomyces acidicola TaxID=2596892 RepID=A0A5N8WTL3_9ACTN|nr:zf-HC2 domain-containing protein [Streptomyces acidicola]MPY49878.1 zf-HC2 domain-containing protein [Streptomyces acidicola]
MSCAQVLRVLQEYLDGETDDVTARRVRAHLDGCRDCGLEARTYREIKNALVRQEQPDARAVARLRGFGESLLDPAPGDQHDRTPGG